jgi:hypothetical protein
MAGKEKSRRVIVASLPAAVLREDTLLDAA